jgi:hypothetical protein
VISLPVIENVAVPLASVTTGGNSSSPERFAEKLVADSEGALSSSPQPPIPTSKAASAIAGMEEWFMRPPFNWMVAWEALPVLQGGSRLVDI